MKVLAQGAEAIIKLIDGKIIKERIKKNYRIQEIDMPLRKYRTRREASLLDKANRAGVPVPKVLSLDDKKMIISIEFIDGTKVRDYLTKDNLKETCLEIGKITAKMHGAEIIHGDLTTSNMIFKDKIYFIDFGLGDFSSKVEDKAVDVHLFKECLNSSHYEHWKTGWESFKEGYEEENKSLANQVFDRLEKVESRGRYKGKA